MTTAEQKKPTDADHTVGSRIAVLRAARGISQTALGQALGVSFQQVQKYEKGRNRVGAGRLQTIADHLGVSVSTFFEAEAGEPRAFEDSGNLPFLGLVGATELLKAYAAISDLQMRRDVLAMVKSAARISRAGSTGETAATERRLTRGPAVGCGGARQRDGRQRPMRLSLRLRSEPGPPRGRIR